MTDSSDSPREDGDISLPPALNRALENLVAPPGGVDTAMDGIIRAAAAHHFAWKRRVLFVAAAASAAALLLAAAWAAWPAAVRHETPPAVTAAMAGPLPGDLNNDGRIDILDAFLLAKRIESKAGLGAEADIDLDGVVDSKDVDALAMLAVRVDGGTAP
jgi:hypothetical protein